MNRTASEILADCLIWIADRLVDAAARLNRKPPKPRPPLNLTPPGDGADDAPHQQEFAWP